MKTTMTTTNHGGVLDRLRAVFGRAKDLTPMSEPVKRVLVEANKDRALKGLDYTGEPYVALKPSTIADRKRKGYPPGPPLVRAGVYARVIQGCRIEVHIEANRVRFLKSWPSVKFMDKHIEGTPKMARRDPLGWGQDEMTEVRRMLPNHVFGRPS